MGGLGRWRVVSGPNESSCTALLLPAEVVSEELDRRIEALTTVRHAHLAATYRSLPTKGGSRVVLGAEVDGLGLDLLREVRPRWEPGEVVTLVAPLAGALACLHRHGLVHGALGSGRRSGTWAPAKHGDPGSCCDRGCRGRGAGARRACRAGHVRPDARRNRSDDCDP